MHIMSVNSHNLLTDWPCCVGPLSCLLQITLEWDTWEQNPSNWINSFIWKALETLMVSPWSCSSPLSFFVLCRGARNTPWGRTLGCPAWRAKRWTQRDRSRSTLTSPISLSLGFRSAIVFCFILGVFLCLLHNFFAHLWSGLIFHICTTFNVWIGSMIIPMKEYFSWTCLCLSGALP